MPTANIVFPHPDDAVAVARSAEGGRLAIERVSPGDWLQVGARLFGGAQVPVGVAAPVPDPDDVVVFLDPEGFDALGRAGTWDADEDHIGLCAARSGEHLALRLGTDPYLAALVLMDDEVRSLAAGAHLLVGEATPAGESHMLDRAAALPLSPALVRGVVRAVDLL